MRTILAILFVIIPAVRTVCADEWPAPAEKDYFSANGKFVAHVTPAAKNKKPSLQVFQIKDTQKIPLWQCELGNQVAPVDVYITDDGGYVVTCNEWHNVGYGDHVVAFYGRHGPIKNYSMEQILHLPKDVTQQELFRLVPHSVSSRWWDRDSIKFLSPSGSKHCFCVWLGLFDRWVAWHLVDGAEVEPDKNLLDTWNCKARLWALQRIKQRPHSDTPYKFLGCLKDPNDRPVIEALLSDPSFTSTKISSRPLVGSPTCKLHRFIAFSSNRALAEAILAKWDGKPLTDDSTSHQPYYHLGKVQGIVRLPRPPKAGKPEIPTPPDGTLCLYLIPGSVPDAHWYRKASFQRLAAAFDRYSFNDFELTEEFPFAIEGVTPGTYWLKAVWGKAEPFNYYAGRIPQPPRPGDYESHNSPLITVEAAKTIDKITLDCTHKVTNGAN